MYQKKCFSRALQKRMVQKRNIICLHCVCVLLVLVIYINIDKCKKIKLRLGRTNDATMRKQPKFAIRM